MRMFSVGVLWLALGGCGGPEPAGDAGTATGTATCEDAETNADGSTRPSPEPPPPGSRIALEVRVEGNGDLSGLDASCAAEGLTGNFTGLLEGEGTVDGDGVYVAGLAQSEAGFTTPSGCAIPDLSISTMTSVVLHATLENTRENCTTYCEAKARAQAEEECSADADEAACRSEAEASYAGSCTTACEGTTTDTIAADTELGVGALADLNASGLTGQSVGTIEADLTFDRLENSEGDDVPEE